MYGQSIFREIETEANGRNTFSNQPAKDKQRMLIYPGSGRSTFLLVYGELSLFQMSDSKGKLTFSSLYSYSNPDFFFSTNHTAMLCIYAGVFTAYLISKWIIYSFINWIFFDKEKNKLWIESVFNIIAAMGLILFPTVLYIIFLDSEFHFSGKIILTIIFISKILLFYKCFRYFFRNFHGVLHLILYFCTLEIIPDLFLWKGIELINSILILKI